MIVRRFLSPIVLALLLLTACAAPPTAPPTAAGGPSTTETAAPSQPPAVLAVDALVPVTAVVDGDTFRAFVAGREESVRVIGIDTPEVDGSRRAPQCFGAEAAAKARELLAGQRVRLIPDASQGDRDRFGRLLRYVERVDGLDFGLWMIERGYAREYTFDTPYQRQAAYRAAAAEARAAKRGLRAPETCDGDTR